MVEKIIRYIKYKLYDQWHFVYFAFPLEKNFDLSILQSFPVRKATRYDLPRMKVELFPLMQREDGDKQYFDLLENEGVECFVIEQENKLVHFSFVFTDLARAPIMRTPLSKKKLRKGDAFIGPLFTVPHARGMWIFPLVLVHVIQLLKVREGTNRLLAFVHDKNPGAVKFYERLGFERL